SPWEVMLTVSPLVICVNAGAPTLLMTVAVPAEPLKKSTKALSLGPGVPAGLQFADVLQVPLATFQWRSAACAGNAIAPPAASTSRAAVFRAFLLCNGLNDIPNVAMMSSFPVGCPPRVAGLIYAAPPAFPMPQAW